VLKVKVRTERWREEEFYACMGKDGRLTIPKLMLELLQREDESLVGYVLEVTIEPAT
jgi:hypothetical protein